MEQKDDSKTYKLLVNCSLALLILFNRRRIGDVQFLKIGDYKKDQRSNSVPEFENALSKTERMLTTKYKRVLNSGKGSRAVVILFPEILQNYVNILLNNREKYIPSDNDYVFAIPGSSIPWGKGDVAIRSLASKMNLENPHVMTSNKLRKHIATVMQILSLSKDEARQFSQFMGHTEKTHQEFYELPVDIYQTAKVSKILLMMEKGTIPVDYKGKSLAEINFDLNLEYAEENNDADDDGEILLNNSVHVTSEEMFESAGPSNNHFVRKENKKIESSTEIENDGLYDLSNKRTARIPKRRTIATKPDSDTDESSDDDIGSLAVKPISKNMKGPKSINKKEARIPKRRTIDTKTDSDTDISSDDDISSIAEKPISKKKRGPKTITKKGWTTAEVEALQSEFGSSIRKKVYSTGQQIKDFILKKNISRTVTVIKSKLQHLMKLGNKN
ncbi:unnamed protein product [Ceutorhynchus assimilis]|uniref:Uncharacterized protein n=1 Tax=Ceutorhynchus assimilis TaxID=467358 RepID=A0A9N9MJQ9_9CUCU|nr:unnamed protein product [Ceutorhynchus assimilis]